MKNKEYEEKAVAISFTAIIIIIVLTAIFN